MIINLKSNVFCVNQKFLPDSQCIFCSGRSVNIFPFYLIPDPFFLALLQSIICHGRKETIYGFIFSVIRSFLYTIIQKPLSLTCFCSNWRAITARIVSKYGVISGPYFPVFGPNKGKYGPEITPYLDTFHPVSLIAPGVWIAEYKSTLLIFFFSTILEPLFRW